MNLYNNLLLEWNYPLDMFTPTRELSPLCVVLSSSSTWQYSPISKQTYVKPFQCLVHSPYLLTKFLFIHKSFPIQTLKVTFQNSRKNVKPVFTPLPIPERSNPTIVNFCLLGSVIDGTTLPLQILTKVCYSNVYISLHHW